MPWIFPPGNARHCPGKNEENEICKNVDARAQHNHRLEMVKKVPADCASSLSMLTMNFPTPWRWVSRSFETLKPGGKLILIEYRLEDPLVPIKKLHKMSQKQAVKELSVVGLQWSKTLDFLPQQHFMIFQKPVPSN